MLEIVPQRVNLTNVKTAACQRLHTNYLLLILFFIICLNIITRVRVGDSEKVLLTLYKLSLRRYYEIESHKGFHPSALSSFEDVEKSSIEKENKTNLIVPQRGQVAQSRVFFVSSLYPYAFIKPCKFDMDELDVLLTRP